MESSLVSVIIPVFNGEKYLAEALHSVSTQTYCPAEVIVIDDGSTDRTRDIARSFANVGYIYQKNQGVAVARNTGIGASNGHFIAFLDHDDYWTPNKLEVQMNYLVAHPDVNLVMTHERIVLEKGIEKPSWLREELLTGDHPGFRLGTAVLRRHVFDQIGLFNPELWIGEDGEWFFRMKEAGIEPAMLSEVLYYRRVHSNNLSANAVQSSDVLLRVIRQTLQRRRENQEHHE